MSAFLPPRTIFAAKMNHLESISAHYRGKAHTFEHVISADDATNKDGAIMVFAYEIPVNLTRDGRFRLRKLANKFRH